MTNFRHTRKIGLCVLVTMAASAAMAGAGTAEEENEWPREISIPEGTITMYQPQVEDLDQNRIDGRAAVSFKSSEEAAPVFGAVWLEARLETNRDDRTATIVDVEVPLVRFPEATEEQQEKLAALLKKEVPTWNLTIPLDYLIADVESEYTEGTAELRNEPPHILVSLEPAVLVQFDGEPTFGSPEGLPDGLEVAVNTPHQIAREKGSEKAYLSGGDELWYVAAAGAMGPWEATEDVPQAVAELFEVSEDADAASEEVAESADEASEDETSESEEAPAGPPAILVATEPSELVVISGEPNWSPVTDTPDLLYLVNTESDVLLDIQSQHYYLLLAGRWYRAPAVEGELQWEWVANDDLPTYFADIPEDSFQGEVLAHVGGTVQAREAVLDNSIPQTAAIDREDASVEVTYDGEPKFEKVEEVEPEIAYAVNTPQAIFKVGDRYYVCEQAVWYEGPSPTGPWSVCISVPSVLHNIPASNPHHNVTYVYVYDVTPKVVYVGYTSGYVHSYVSHGCVVYGTGYVYHPWYGSVCYPRPWTWGIHVRYSSYYGWSFGLSNGYFNFYYSDYKRPNYHHHHYHGWWGSGGYRPPHYRPRPPYPGRPPHRPGRPPHRPGGPGRPTHPIAPGRPGGPGGPGRPSAGQLPSHGSNIYDRPGNRDRVAARPMPADRKTPAISDRANNVLTDRSGNVYRRDEASGWQQRQDKSWQPAQGLDRTRPSTPSTRPSTPTTRPSTPSTRPSTPTTRPSTPSTRPSTPTTRPSTPSTRPSTPSTRPSSPSVSQRPSATRPQLERDSRARSRGQTRNQNYRSSPSRSSGGMSRGGGASRGGGMSRGGGGMSRGGGGRRR